MRWGRIQWHISGDQISWRSCYRCFFFCAQKTGLLCPAIRGLGEKLKNEWRVRNGRSLGFVSMTIGDVDGWIFVPKNVEQTVLEGRRCLKSLPVPLEVTEDDTAWFDRPSPPKATLKGLDRLGKAAMFASIPFSECVIPVKIGCFSVKTWGFRRFHRQIHLVTSFSSPLFEKGQQLQPN